MLEAQGKSHPLQSLGPVASLEEVVELRRAVTEVRIAPAMRRYVVDIVGATRATGSIRIGASPRASLSIQKLAQALALIDGEDFVAPEHVREIVVPALAHRVTLDAHARFGGTSAAEVVGATLAKVPLPA
jgi:MoxR-like ATPase